MIFLDTHVALWLYAEPKTIPGDVRNVLEGDDLFLSPMARMEISFLHEIGRLRDDPVAVIGFLERHLALTIEDSGWSRAAETACHLSWTRDPFDRLITAHAMVFGAELCTRDRVIREHYRKAFW